MSFWKKKSPHLLETSRKLAEQGVTSDTSSVSISAANAVVPKSVSTDINVSEVEQRFGSVKSAVSSGTVIEGRLSFDIPVRIDGKLTGEIYSSQPVIVGPSASISASIEAPVLVVFGKVNGSVNAREKVDLQPGGYLEADIATGNLIVAEGAVFNGSAQKSSIAQT